MLIFNCTQAAQDFFTITRKGEKQTIVEVPPSQDMSNDAQHLRYADGSPAQPFQWVLHTVSIKRKNCLVAMEVNTRFAVSVTAVKKGDIEYFLTYFRAFLASLVSGYAQVNGIWQTAEIENHENQCMTHLREAHLFRRSDRSVQTQINEVVRMLRDFADESPNALEDDRAMLRFNQFTNDHLRKSRAFPDQNYINPVEEMLLFWQQRYLNATPAQLTNIRQRLADNRRIKYQDIISDIAAPDSPRTANKPSDADDEPQVFFPEDTPLDAAELAFLDKILAKYATEESLETVSALHGFLTAIVSAPKMMPPSQWLAEIWGGEDLQPAWKNIDEVQRFMGILFTLMNNISRELREAPQTFSPVFMGKRDAPNVSEWCFGYTCVVGLDEEAWEALPDDLQAQLDLIDTYGFMVEVNPNTVSRNTLRERANQVVDAATQLHAYWFKQRPPMLMPTIGKPTPSPQPVVTQKLVGRNDPCPCGSGKKYKKCCLH